ncbi:MAG TPA: hypothetical protein PLO61_04720 [Fimbriimonadaceae bacterium]|nr:hypothetical protein [Fimbriimonadaceae bacterium]HRJ32523.1 hypothetical protein [Fimbriimonadaceae bacterium]
MLELRESAFKDLVGRLNDSRDPTHQSLGHELQSRFERLTLTHRTNATAREAWQSPSGFSKMSDAGLARTGELLLEALCAMNRLDEVMTVEAARSTGKTPAPHLAKKLLELTQRIPETFWKAARCCPIRWEGHRLMCLISEPIDLATLNALSRLAGAELILRVASWEEVCFGIETLYSASVPVAVLSVSASDLAPARKAPARAAKPAAKPAKRAAKPRVKATPVENPISAFEVEVLSQELALDSEPSLADSIPEEIEGIQIASDAAPAPAPAPAPAKPDMNEPQMLDLSQVSEAPQIESVPEVAQEHPSDSAAWSLPEPDLEQAPEPGVENGAELGVELSVELIELPTAEEPVAKKYDRPILSPDEIASLLGSDDDESASPSTTSGPSLRLEETSSHSSLDETAAEIAPEIAEESNDEESDNEKDRVGKKLKPGWLKSMTDKFKKAS